MLWANIVMDTLACYALTTDAPSEVLANNK
jgi:hypothetical protein